MGLAGKRPCDDVPVRKVRFAGRPSASAPWVLAVTIIGSGMAFIDSSAVGVALPSIQAELHADAASLQWVIEGYSLFLSALILVGGSFGDRFGRRRVFLLGIALFAVASIACAAAQTIGELNVARCFQGVGGALATPGSLALISANFDDAERGRAIGTWSGFASITAAIGPLLGGWIAQSASWRYVFLINVPLSLFVIAGGVLRVPESRDPDDTGSIDLLGAALVTGALGSLTFGLIRLEAAVHDGLGIGCAAAGLLLLAAFVRWEQRARAPMIPLSVFANRTFTAANIYTFLVYAALYGSLYFVPFDLQNVLHYSPTAAGAAMLPFIVIMFVFSRPSGGLVATIGARTPLVGGAILTGFGFLAYARAAGGGSYWSTFFPAALLLGAGGALFVAPLTTTVMEAIDQSEAGIASGINNAVARVAGLLAIAVLGIVLVSSLSRAFEAKIGTLTLTAQSWQTLARDRDALGTGRPLGGLSEPDRAPVNAALAAAYTLGFQRVMLLSALAAWIAAAIALWMVPSGRHPSK